MTEFFCDVCKFWIKEGLYYIGCPTCHSKKEEATPYANGLIKEFLEDFEKVVRYFKLDGHLVGTIRRKWQKKLAESGSGGEF